MFTFRVTGLKVSTFLQDRFWGYRESRLSLLLLPLLAGGLCGFVWLSEYIYCDGCFEDRVIGAGGR
jgi:hypothetical protein